MSLAHIFTHYFTGLVVVLLAHRVWHRHVNLRRLPLPPGPKPLPLLGNLLDLPRKLEWLTYRAWNEQYGDVVYVEALGQKIVILGTADAVSDLMERRGSIYSHRAGSEMISELMGFKWMLTLLPCGDHWRRGRRLIHSYFGQTATPAHHHAQVMAARRLARDILDAPQTPETLAPLVQFNFAQTIMKIMYGIDAQDKNDPYVLTSEKVVEALNVSMVPGKFLVDFMPLLRYLPSWMPGAGFQRFAQDTSTLHHLMRDAPFQAVKTQMANDTASPSVVRDMLNEATESGSRAASPAQEQMIKDIAGITYLGGSDTTVSLVVSFVLAMLVYPEVQKCGQEEVDRVVGSGRLPDLSDREHLPYVNAIVSECYRWLPATTMGVPHSTDRDDEYRGYFIPKGTLVLGSTWAILHDPEEYHNPEMFDPERFLVCNTSVADNGMPTKTFEPNPSVRDPRTAAFGFGRRICPGIHLADASLFAMISTILATVDVVRAKKRRSGTNLRGEEEEIVPQVEVASGLLNRPLPFEYAVRPRSGCVRQLLDASLQD